MGRVGLALATTVLLVAAFPAPDRGELAWIALAPLALACRDLRPVPAAALGLLAGGAVAFGVRSRASTVPRGPLAIYLGLYPALWCMGLGRLARIPLPLALTAPALWVALDYARVHAGFLAVAWTALAHSHHRNVPILRVARTHDPAGHHGRGRDRRRPQVQSWMCADCEYGADCLEWTRGE
jgi:apolipoprotein N-acyltransferase